MEGTGSTFFGGFFDWIASAFSTLLGWLFGIVDAVVHWLSDVVTGVWSWIGGAAQFFADLVGNVWNDFTGFIFWLLGLPAELIEWVNLELQALIDRMSGTLAGLVPSLTFLDGAQIATVVAYAKQFGAVFPVYECIAIAITSATVVGAIIVFKLVWRSIPTIG